MAGGWPAGGNMHDILETCITTGINCIRERLINRNCSSPNTQKKDGRRAPYSRKTSMQQYKQ